jgi:hypothetical protein
LTLHVCVPVVAVPYLAALLEQGIRLLELEDPPALLDRSDPHVLLCEFRVLSQDLALECVALLTTHRSNVERIVRSRDVLDRLFGPAMDPRDPSIRGPVSAVRIIGPDPGQVGRHDLVRVFLELASKFVAKGLSAGLRLRPSDLRTALRAPLAESSRVWPE